MKHKKSVLKRAVLWISGLIGIFILVLILNLVLLLVNEEKISAGQPIPNYDNEQAALLVVDIQEIITGETSVFPELREQSEPFIQSINRAVDSFRIHKAPVIYVRSEINNPFINLLNSTYAKGSPGVAFDRRLQVVSDLEVIKSGKDSFRKTHLDEILQKNKVNALYIVGLDAAECVNATIEAALNRKYQVNVIREAVISKSQQALDSMLLVFRDRGVGLLPMDSLRLH
ncbi:MAG: isochorismatase family cysteine hydrolase [Bacteroidales bacterium]